VCSLTGHAAAANTARMAQVKRPVGPMPDEPTRFAGGMRRTIMLALWLTSFIPLVVVAYSLYAYVLPLLDRARQVRDLPWLQALLVLTGLLMAVGALLIWDLTRALPRPEPAAPAPVHDERLHAASASLDDADTLLHSFSRMLAPIEQQAAALDRYATRLDSAYQELESTSARLKEFSFKDEVTGLYNRRFFSIRLEEEVSRYRRFNHPVSVVLLDLDAFKSVNDDLGHAAGDETLRGMAEILLRHSRGINVICRYGGDEFAVLLVETSKAGARLYADRIRYVLSSYHFTHLRRVTASFGIASLPEDVAPTAGDLIQAADEALYAAKRAGKNRVSVHEDIAVTQPAPSEAKVE
jgi:diguanylate cyclase (GGDEF)-like protein